MIPKITLCLTAMMAILALTLSESSASADHWRDDGNSFTPWIVTGGAGTGTSTKNPANASTASGTNSDQASVSASGAQHSWTYVDDNGQPSANTASLTIQVTAAFSLYRSNSPFARCQGGVSFNNADFTGVSRDDTYGGEADNCGSHTYNGVNTKFVQYTFWSVSQGGSAYSTIYVYFFGT